MVIGTNISSKKEALPRLYGNAPQSKSDARKENLGLWSSILSGCDPKKESNTLRWTVLSRTY